MKTYLANVPVMDDEDFGFYLCVEYEAESQDDAEAISDENGWDYLGEKVCEIDCDDEIVAMIEKHAHNETEH